MRQKPDPDFIQHTTGLEIPGYEIINIHGVVKGLVIVPHTIIEKLMEMIFPDKHRAWIKREDIYNDALKLLLQNTAEKGGYAVIGVRFNTTVTHSFTEVLVYGTAVEIELNADDYFS